MSTPLTDRIEALTSQANAVTGASDTTLTDAVGRLISGYSADLYPVGTDIITRYIGRNGEAHPLWQYGKYNRTTGEIVLDEEPEGGNWSTSLTYIPINPTYTYLKGVSYLGFLLFYDADYHYITYEVKYSNRNWQVIENIPDNARYIRVGSHSSSFYDQLEIIRIA